MLRDSCTSSLSSSRDEWEEILEEVKLGESGGYPKEPLIVNELENNFDPDVFMTQRVRRDSRITENKRRGIIAAKMKIMIDEYKVRRQSLELFVTQIDELYGCWYPKKGNNSSYHQANGDAWGSSSSGNEKLEANGSNQGRSSSVDANFAGGAEQSFPALPGYQKIDQHPQPSSSASQPGTKHGKHAMTSGNTTHDTETSSKNIIAKKRKRSTSISKTSDASTEPDPKRRSKKKVSASTVDDPTTSLNARRISVDKTQKRKPFDEKMKEITALNKEVYYLEH
ncbi:hypothetical protein BTUL_0045g00050 [Botrytis tulipae]|uniref:Uncharacterized protein n=1 Tax=Botrytis tulipae TaxID=87230 RepID=A0A4Z1ERR2_9HELO|nr:hypothetical protein BTUL_0045g00050 [Botrytis tulipae]